jgi:hypothetical protein
MLQNSHNINKTIVYHQDDFSNLMSPFLEKIWHNFFKLEKFDPRQNYNVDQHIFWSSHLFDTTWYEKFHKNGHKVIIDQLFISNTVDTADVKDNILNLCCKNWAWYNTSLWFQFEGYRDYIPNKNKKHSFLMLINKQKDFRDRLFNKIDLTNGLYSYLERNITIANDTEHIGGWIVYFNSDWYDSTQFSIVCENSIEPPLLISEKTFKPIAHYHPYIVWGAPGTLFYLKKLGFESFSHVIDETYDVTLDKNSRLDLICEQIKVLNENYQAIFNDKLTQEILQHNNNLFYNKSVVNKNFKNEIIDPVLNFIEN